MARKALSGAEHRDTLTGPYAPVMTEAWPTLRTDGHGAYRLPETGTPRSALPVLLTPVKDQRLPHERLAAPAAPVAPAQPGGMSARPLTLNSDAARARVNARNTQRAALARDYRRAIGRPGPAPKPRRQTHLERILAHIQETDPAAAYDLEALICALGLTRMQLNNALNAVWRAPEPRPLERRTLARASGLCLQVRLPSPAPWPAPPPGHWVHDGSIGEADASMHGRVLAYMRRDPAALYSAPQIATALGVRRTDASRALTRLLDHAPSLVEQQVYTQTGKPGLRGRYRLAGQDVPWPDLPQGARLHVDIGPRRAQAAALRRGRVQQ